MSEAIDTETRRTHILLSAAHCFAQTGYANTPMRKIAGRAKVSRSALYQIADSKSALFDAMMSHIHEPVAAHCRGALHASLSADRAMLAIADAVNLPDVMALVIEAPCGETLVSPSQDSAQRIVRSSRAALLSVVQDWLTSQSQEGHLFCPAPSQTAKAILAAYDGARHGARRFCEYETALTTQAALLARGLEF